MALHSLFHFYFVYSFLFFFLSIYPTYNVSILFYQEAVSGTALKLVESDEYSESGRGVYPDGLFRVLLHYHERYKHLKIPFIITENGVSDETDLIRRPYILEHLLAVYGAMMMVLVSNLFIKCKK